MREALLVVLGLLVGALLTELQQRDRRREQLADNRIAEADEQRRWYRDLRLGAYAEVARAIDGVERAAARFISAVASRDGIDKTRAQLPEDYDRLRVALMGVACLAPMAVQTKDRSLLGEEGGTPGRLQDWG
jgi:hypothetical protein